MGQSKVVLLSYSLLDDGMFVLQLPLLHGRVDDQLIQLRGANDSRVRETRKLNCEKSKSITKIQTDRKLCTLIHLLIPAVCV